jgi:Uri superfamily endonuclease
VENIGRKRKRNLNSIDFSSIRALHFHIDLLVQNAITVLAVFVATHRDIEIILSRFSGDYTRRRGFDWRMDLLAT